MDGEEHFEGIPKRILIYGVTGSGKTTFAAQLSQDTGIPWQEVDALMWNPGWEFVPLEQQRERMSEICARDEWILDAGYAKWMDIVLPNVDLILCLDYSRGRTFWQLLKRTIARCMDKKEVCNGNIETFKGMFSKDSILLWHFKSFDRKRERMRSWEKGPTDFQVILFKNSTDLVIWQAEQILADSKLFRESIGLSNEVLPTQVTNRKRRNPFRSSD
jgi:adenylate kinase family enzyme